MSDPSQLPAGEGKKDDPALRDQPAGAQNPENSPPKSDDAIESGAGRSMSEDAPLPTGAHAAVLRKASDDLILLVAHCSRLSKIENEKIEDLLGLSRRAAAGILTVSEESIFWEEYGRLVQSARPASVDALHIENYSGSLGWPRAGRRLRIVRLLPFATRSAIEQHLRTLWIIRALAVAVFAITLILVAYLTFTDGLLKKNNDLTHEYMLLMGPVVTGTQIEAIANEYNNKLPQSPPRPGQNNPPIEQTRSSTISPTPAPATQPVDQPIEQGASGPKPTPGANGTSAPLGAANSAILYSLIDSRKEEIREAVAYNEALLKQFQPQWIASLAGQATAASQPSVDLPLQSLAIDTPTRTLQSNINQMLSRYVLPLLAGALGVFVYIMRTASAQFKDLSFAATDVSTYWPRIILGIVAGLVIGWFLGQEQSGVLASISPAALAFITGYSVEIFFNLLDSIIKALGADARA